MLKRSVVTVLLSLLVPVLFSGCAKPRQSLLTQADAAAGTLSAETLALNTSAEAPLAVRSARLITDNDGAFAAKAALIQNAQNTLDLVYYIFSDDYSSSVLASELIAAAKRGVHVRLLADYFVNYKRLDYFEALQQYGNSGRGSLEVRFFNRPTDRIILDAAYLTLGCAGVGKEKQYAECAEEKFRVLEEELQSYRAAHGPQDELVPSNYNSGGSGTVLSALYTQNVGLLADSIVAGKELHKDNTSAVKEEKSPAQKERHLKLKLAAAQMFWKARSTNPAEWERITANLKIGLGFLLFGAKLNPLYDMLSAYFPVNRPKESKEALRDWQYLTQFTHHKLLLADDRRFIFGGRNVEDTYHMHKNELTPHYVFMDSDMEVELNAPSPKLRSAFDRLWDYRIMTATLADVREHAPNDFLLAFTAAEAKCAGAIKTGSTKRDECPAEVFSSTLPLSERVNDAHKRLQERSKEYALKYRSASSQAQSPSFVVDRDAALYYLENLPFNKDDARHVRLFGVKDDQPAESGRYIHNIWLAALRNVCTRAAAEHPQDVVFHNAYFLLPAPVLRRLGEMVDGSLDCRNVRITVLTNSPQTTDLAIINLAARYSLKAFTEFMASKRDSKKGATFRYLEYVPKSSGGPASDISLHSKVMVFGDDIFVGSANADVRSYMMDTNNGMLIRNAPGFRDSYLKWITSLIENQNIVRDETSFFANAKLKDLLEHDRTAVRGTLVTLFALSNPDKVPQPVVDLIMEMLVKVYGYSRDILSSPAQSVDERYNDALKLL